MMGASPTQIWIAPNVFVLLTIRAQPQFLASHYAQNSNKIFKASTKGFEHFVSTLTSGVPENIDWSYWKRCLSEAIGDEYIWMLPMEAMSQEAYWLSLAQLLGTEGVEGRAQDHGHENRKRAREEYKWSLRPFSFKAYALKTAKGRFSKQSARFKARRRAARLGAKPVDAVVALGSPLYRDKTLVLHPAVKADILEKYRDSNRALAAEIGWDLEAMGYA